ncbi:translational activator of GCN4 [Batrachochytrium dendrobatidis]|nr:translational activator of GCN4 [Batrachochytrium dendrobatidis]
MNSSITGSVSESSSVLTCVLNTLQHHYTTVTLHLTRYTRYTLSTCLNHVLTALRWMVQTSRHVSGSMQWSGSPRFLGDLHGGFVRIIKDSKSMDNEGLWFLGFFGKGSLSRGVPTWWKRHHHPKGVSQEGIASQKRAHAMADARMTIVSETSSDPEMYILMMEEAVYLVVCDQKLLQVRGSQGNILTIQDLWQQCRLARQSKATLDASEFAIQFAVYRYYQSQGWIVKSGHLFGADYGNTLLDCVSWQILTFYLVLYRDGPTRKHSE